MGSGVPDSGTDLDFEPTTGELGVRVYFEQHWKLTRAQFNDIRAAGVNAGGVGNETAAWAAIKTAADAIQSGRGAWFDRMTTGADSAETALLRRGRVWLWCAMGEIPAPPQP